MAAIYREIWDLLRSPLGIGVAIAGNILVIQSSVFFGIIDPVAAQNIVTDGTLGTPAGAVPIIPNGTLNNPAQPNLPTLYPNAYIIQEALGRTVGDNLFHSFSRFNLSNSESAVFQSGGNIRNILSRVTGGNASIIDGLIQTQSTNVNLFLINPQGIVFGPNAKLDIGGANGRGSFVATTTDSLVWGNDPARQFNARTPSGADSLLTLVGDPSGFLVGQTRPGAIAINGSQLNVFPNQRLLFLGSDFTQTGGELFAQGGQIEIAAIAGAGTIGLNLDNPAKFGFAIPNTVERADVLINRGVINTSARDTPSGDISIQAKTITVTNESRLFAETAGAGNAGDIYLDASDSIEISNQSTLQSVVRSGGVGDGGVVFLRAPGSVSILNGSGLFSVIDQGGSGKFGTNDFAGNVFDALLGRAGKPIVGSVFIDAGSILLSNGSVLNASTLGNGNAGAVVALAQGSITITNGSAIGSIVRPTANGSAGGVILAASSILIDGSSGLTTSTLGKGDAGLILAVASDRITIDGNSGIFSRVAPGLDQTAGAIVIVTKVLELQNGARISVDNAGSGSAGDIFITGLGVYLNRGARISAITKSGQGGNIQFQVGVLILNNNSNISTEAGTAEAGGNGGNVLITGSTFRFGRDRAFIVSGKPIGNSNIRANAFTGNGGSISILAYKLTDIARRADVSATNDIDASSRFGLSGTVNLSVLDIDPERGTVALTGRLTDVTSLIAEGCDSRGKLSSGRLVSTGRGGLPSSPVETLADETVVANWVAVPERNQASEQQPIPRNIVTASRPEPAELDLESLGNAPTSENSSQSVRPTFTNPKPTSPNPQNRPPSFEIVEAQGWEVDADGTVMLVAQAKTTEPQIPWLLPGTCPVPQ